MRRRDAWRLKRLKKRAEKENYLGKATDVARCLGSTEVSDERRGPRSSTFDSGGLEILCSEENLNYSSLYRNNVTIHYQGQEVFSGVRRSPLYGGGQILGYIPGPWESVLEGAYRQVHAIKDEQDEVKRQERLAAEQTELIRFGLREEEKPIKDQ